MGAPVGNQFWKLRSKHGRDKIFSTPENLWNSACEYFDWVDKHPWKRNEAIKSGNKVGKIIKIPTQRPYTIEGLYLFLDVNKHYFNDFKKNATEGFSEVISRIENVIYTQKFEGAVVGAFNANIISRDLGLIDKLQHGGDPDKPIKHDVTITRVVFEDMTEVKAE